MYGAITLYGAIIIIGITCGFIKFWIDLAKKNFPKPRKKKDKNE